MLRKLYRLLRRDVLHYLMPVSHKTLFADGRRGVEVVGFFHSPTGIGESARLCAQQLASNGFKVRCVSVERFFRKPEEQAWAFENTAREDEIGCRIIHANPPMLPPIVLGIGLRRYVRVFNIGYWAWELERIPKEWTRALRYVNAIFTPSNFTTAAIKRETSKPVITVPHPVTLPASRDGIRTKLNIPQDTFVVSTIFSFGSAVERKNPWALISAFTKAFGDSPDTRLVLKTTKGGSSAQKAALLESIKPFANISLIDESWDKDEVAGLIKESNLYASLHRSEGFGLTIAEAMLLGTPVLCSNWSGNMDFCNDENCFLVRTNPVAVQSTNSDFDDTEGLVWADADADHAAEILTTLRANPEKALIKSVFCYQKANAYFQRLWYIMALEGRFQPVTVAESLAQPAPSKEIR